MQTLHSILARAHERAEELQLDYAGALTPLEAWAIWQGEQCAPGVRLIDVRTRAEWTFVGRIPGAVEIEWLGYPDNQVNPQFLQQLRSEVDPESLLLFLCRSGVRSHQAAVQAAQAGFASCYNVLEGFEGGKNAREQRNLVNGWRFAGLPWVQG